METLSSRVCFAKTSRLGQKSSAKIALDKFSALVDKFSEKIERQLKSFQPKITFQVALIPVPEHGFFPLEAAWPAHSCAHLCTLCAAQCRKNYHTGITTQAKTSLHDSICVPVWSFQSSQIRYEGTETPGLLERVSALPWRSSSWLS